MVAADALKSVCLAFAAVAGLVALYCRAMGPGSAAGPPRADYY